MSESRLAAIVIDCLPERFEESVRFWAEALGARAPARPRKGQRYVHLRRDHGGIEVIIQRVEKDPGIHLDLDTDAPQEEIARLESAGAARKHKVKRWWVMRDPSGHAFCLLPRRM